MLTQKSPFLRSLGTFSKFAGDRLIRPVSYLARENYQQARLFNILLLLELSIFLVSLVVIFLYGSNFSRLFSVTAWLLTGTVLAYAVAKGGRSQFAAWVNALGILAVLAYYNLAHLQSDPLLVYQDFRIGGVLLVLPVLIAGLAVGARTCLAITGFSMVVFVALGLWTVPFSPSIANNEAAFYNQLLRIPVALIFIICLLTLTFERNILGLFNRVSRRNYNLKADTGQLAAEVEQSEKRLAALNTGLADLEKICLVHQDLTGLQETTVLEIRSWENRLRQSIQHLSLLLVQVSASLGDSQQIIAQRGEAIRTNSAVYNRLQQLMELINHSVEELARAAIQIEQVVGSISEVAEETNLLALNASIEAAGHLEQGRRFTVVAAEVYRLAVRSRDAAEEVRQVANQVQGSVTSLAEVSSQGRDQAYTLAQSARSAPLLVDQLSDLMDNLGQTGKGVFRVIKDLQNDLGELLEGLPPVTARSEELGRSNRRLLNYILTIKQALVNFSEPDRATPDPVAVKTRLAGEPSGRPSPTGELQSAQTFYHKLQKGWLKGIFPSRYLLVARRRQSRLLNGLCLSFCLFLGGYTVFLLLTGFEISSFLPVALFLVLLLLAYSFSKTGFHEFALGFFFG
jgi:methyl-accepting chemotaxis protein